MAGEEYDARGDTVLKARHSDDTVSDLLDSLGALVSIPLTHHEIHEGDAYSIGFLSGSIASASAVKLSLEVGAKEIHLKFIAVNVTGAQKSDAEAQFEEAITNIAGGADTTPRNRNRNAADGSTVTAKTGVSFTAGTLLDIGSFGGTQGGANERAFEMILKKNTNYGLTMTNRSNAAATMSAFLIWYEED